MHECFSGVIEVLSEKGLDTELAPVLDGYTYTSKPVAHCIVFLLEEAMEG